MTAELLVFPFGRIRFVGEVHEDQAQVLLLSRGTRILRGTNAEATRRDRLKYLRRAAFNRAVHGGYNAADEAMFGSDSRLIREGPDWQDPASDQFAGPSCG